MSNQGFSDGDLYDEFGNYIGQDDESRDENDSRRINTNSREGEQPLSQNLLMRMEDIQPSPSNYEIVLHEDKQIYQDSTEIYGDEVEIMVEQEDTQPIEEPIIKYSKKRYWDTWEKEIPELTFNFDYAMSTMENPNYIRNIAICGHLHHGKTALMDMFVKQTHSKYRDFSGRVDADSESHLRYTDFRFDEVRRKISIKSSPLTLLLPTSRGKHYIFNMIDCPGHSNFTDESVAGISLSDGVVIVVDVCEGLMLVTERIIHLAVRYNLPIVLVLNKIDRLITELRLPPMDAYQKMRYVISQVNKVLSSLGSTQHLSPVKGNVCFASTMFEFCFTLDSFASIYLESIKSKIELSDFVKRLWGPIYFNSENRTFSKNPLNEGDNNSFVHFILEPLYKIFSNTLGSKPKEIQYIAKNLGIRIKQDVAKQDGRKVLLEIMKSFFVDTSSLVDIITKHVPSPIDGANNKLKTIYSGQLNSNFTNYIEKCDRNGPLLIYVSKLYHNKECEDFWAFGRILSGTIRKGQEVKVLNSNYTPSNDEDASIQTVSNVLIHNSRYQLEKEYIPAGNWVLIEGIDSTIVKTATIVDPNNNESHICSPLIQDQFNSVKIAIEPLNPSDLPKMMDGLRRVNKAYPNLITKIEESGEHVLIGTGELYMDSVMLDLRKLYSGIEIKVSDPFASFSETISETSSIKCYSNSSNQMNQISMIAEPLELGLAEEIERGNINLNASLKELKNILGEYDWDLLATRSLWAFGPEEKIGPNVLLNETFPNQVDPTALGLIKDSIIQGFRWATKEGPLCDEPIRSVKFKILDATISTDPFQRNSGQIIPAARKVTFSSFLTATPRLMEPIYKLEIQTSLESIKIIYEILEKRRGHVLDNRPIPATPFYIIDALVPVMDSYGLETDIRIHTQGMAFSMAIFHGWSVVPGDPLDTSIELKLLEPAPPQYLAREFMVKTRRRKGLGGEPSLKKYFDPSLLEEYERQETDYMNAFGLGSNNYF